MEKAVFSYVEDTKWEFQNIALIAHPNNYTVVLNNQEKTFDCIY